VLFAPRRVPAGIAVTLTTLALVGAGGVTGMASAAPPTTPYISEIHYDNGGTDTGEFVEVHLPAGTTSDGLSVVLYNGSNGTTYDTDAVPAVTAPADAPAVAVVDYPSNGIQNGGPDAVALVDADDNVVDFVSYEGALTATNGPASGMTAADIGVSEAGTEDPGLSLQATYDATADALVWTGPIEASKGVVNGTEEEPEPEPEPEICPVEPTHLIGEVQGEGEETPIAGTSVTVRGTVVGDLPSFLGFYLQGEDDGNPRTSDGIFVFTDGDPEVDLGDTVAVTGTASDRFGQTQISAFENVDVCEEGTGADLPDAVVLDLPADDMERERFEGMLVTPVDTSDADGQLTVSEVFQLTRFGELMLSAGGVLVQPTELADAGSEEAKAIAVENERRRIILDDGLDSSRSATNRPYLSPETPVRVGDELTFTEPLVLGYGFSNWRLQPADGTADGVFAPQNTRPAAPDEVGGDIQVAAFNVLNYFVTWSGENARGARNEEQFLKQAGKIVPAIEALDAEIVTLMEIEDTDSTGYSEGDADQALADLVERLNAYAGDEDKWAYVPLPDELYAVDRDVIRNGIIYQPAAVTPYGEPVGLVDEEVWFNAREPIAQTFLSEDDVFTVVANHFKSKSPGDDPIPPGDNQPVGEDGDGVNQGAFNGDRVRQAQSLVGFVEELQAMTEDFDVLLLGDFNAYSQEDPIQVLEDAGLVNLGSLDPGRYSYVFDALSGSLDHALATPALASKVTDLAHWNINAVESFSYQYTGDPALYDDDPYRSSDHDPLVLGVDLRKTVAGGVKCHGLRPTIVGTNGRDVIVGTNKRDVIMALGGDDKIVGNNGNDVICGGSGDDEVFGVNGADVLYGGVGDDRIQGGNGGDRLVGGPGEDVLVQGRGKGPMIQDGRSS
jgi:predicted extracellular nuclease